MFPLGSGSPTTSSRPSFHNHIYTHHCSQNTVLSRSLPPGLDDRSPSPSTPCGMHRPQNHVIVASIFYFSYSPQLKNLTQWDCLQVLRLRASPMFRVCRFPHVPVPFLMSHVPRSSSISRDISQYCTTSSATSSTTSSATSSATSS